MRTIDIIFAELIREQKKLNSIQPTDTKTLLKQSQVVDKLVVEYHRAMQTGNQDPSRAPPSLM